MSEYTVRYTADLHLFDSVSVNWRDDALMLERDIVDEWNSVVRDNDVTFIVGDIGRDCPNTYNIIRQLKGRKILILGNHDREWDWTEEKCALFDGIHDFILQNGVLLIHDPKDADYFNYKWAIHGHLHNYEAMVLAKYHDIYVHSPRRLNAAIDLNTPAPSTITQLMYNKSLYVAEHTA